MNDSETTESDLNTIIEELSATPMASFQDKGANIENPNEKTKETYRVFIDYLRETGMSDKEIAEVLKRFKDDSE